MPPAEEGHKKREPHDVTALYVVGKVTYTNEQQEEACNSSRQRGLGSSLIQVIVSVRGPKGDIPVHTLIDYGAEANIITPSLLIYSGLNYNR